MKLKHFREFADSDCIFECDYAFQIGVIRAGLNLTDKTEGLYIAALRLEDALEEYHSQLRQLNLA